MTPAPVRIVPVRRPRLFAAIFAAGLATGLLVAATFPESYAWPVFYARVPHVAQLAAEHICESHDGVDEIIPMYKRDHYFIRCRESVVVPEVEITERKEP